MSSGLVALRPRRQLLLTDARSHSSTTATWLGLGAGLCGLMCLEAMRSGAGRVVEYGASVPQDAARASRSYVILLAASYAVWPWPSAMTTASVAVISALIMRRIRVRPHAEAQTTFGAGAVSVFGVLLALVLVGGMLLAPGQRRRTGHLTSLTAPISLLAGAVVLLVITAVNRTAILASTGPVESWKVIARRRDDAAGRQQVAAAVI